MNLDIAHWGKTAKFPELINPLILGIRYWYRRKAYNLFIIIKRKNFEYTANKLQKFKITKIEKILAYKYLFVNTASRPGYCKIMLLYVNVPNLEHTPTQC